MRVRFAYELVKASLMRNMCAGELKDSLASQSVLEGLFADDAFSTRERPLPSRMSAIYVKHAGHARLGSLHRSRNTRRRCAVDRTAGMAALAARQASSKVGELVEAISRGIAEAWM